ncbi:hypothetical protein MSG28_006557 [Choristoneura fumiferana]|uniref:Uncharacterized protein n=1 Tax=Choristoneura fumiferana TaxID=7141 RepID=A0ACC0JFF0_CHOFU|nr:hypothetical protein MSG28_006557 [Choristoneura fumiferana]
MIQFAISFISPNFIICNDTALYIICDRDAFAPVGTPPYGKEKNYLQTLKIRCWYVTALSVKYFKYTGPELEVWRPWGNKRVEDSNADVGVKTAKLKRDWAGHICRMNPERWAKIVTEWAPSDRYRNRGRPKRRWRDLDAYNVGWRELAFDRQEEQERRGLCPAFGYRDSEGLCGSRRWTEAGGRIGSVRLLSAFNFRFWLTPQFYIARKEGEAYPLKTHRYSPLAICGCRSIVTPRRTLATPAYTPRHRLGWPAPTRGGPDTWSSSRIVAIAGHRILAPLCGEGSKVDFAFEMLNPDFNDYQLTSIITECCGGGAVVYSALYKPSKQYVAVKRYFVDKSKENANLIQQDILTRKELQHQNILPYLTSFVHGRELYVVSPLMSLGSCRDVLDHYFHEGLPELACAIILRDVLSALQYLHKQLYIHRSIRASHVLLAAGGGARLSGLRSAASLLVRGRRARQLHALPPPDHDNTNLMWLSPELLEQNLKGYDERSDIYSVGVLCCELGNGAVPFAEVPTPLMFTEKVRGSRPQLLDCSTFPEAADDEMKSMYAGDSGVGDGAEASAALRQLYCGRKLSDSFHQLSDLALQSAALRQLYCGRKLSDSFHQLSDLALQSAALRQLYCGRKLSDSFHQLSDLALQSCTAPQAVRQLPFSSATWRCRGNGHHHHAGVTISAALRQLYCGRKLSDSFHQLSDLALQSAALRQLYCGRKLSDSFHQLSDLALQSAALRQLYCGRKLSDSFHQLSDLALQSAALRQLYCGRKLSDSFHQLSDLALQRDPEKRPSATQLLGHAFFKQIRKSDHLPSLIGRVKPIKPDPATALALSSCLVGSFQSGRQSARHPAPGAPYYAVGFPRHSLLPDTPLGRQLPLPAHLSPPAAGSGRVQAVPNVVCKQGVHFLKSQRNSGIARNPKSVRELLLPAIPEYPAAGSLYTHLPRFSKSRNPRLGSPTTKSGTIKTVNEKVSTFSVQ